ncbi:hypothetical protein OS493_035055 [Desmophyllum pertusum]|uniref:Uncharacterized protein n=1 Tax=Desmophyllum pertusum TaxID=174260 RepID=A0A9W9ZW20_9CNID|nr:hypothetical protein OS493_035055 [Desmophyllum pertusum]
MNLTDLLERRESCTNPAKTSNRMHLVVCGSGSKSFKKKFKGKGDDIKLKVKPKKFTKDIKGDRSPGQKRKANDADDHKKKTFKAKKWKGQEEAKMEEWTLKTAK